MDGVAVALAAPDLSATAHMYRRLGEGVRFAEMIALSQRVEAQRLLRVVRERAVSGLRRWVERFNAPHYEVTHALQLLDLVVRFDNAQVDAAMENARTPEEAGWTLAVHLATREEALVRDVVPRDIVRAITKAALNGALELTQDFAALEVHLPASDNAKAA